MGSLERTKKRVQIHNKAIVHFLICFVMGFFIGFAPTDKSSFFPTSISPLNQTYFPSDSIPIYQEQETQIGNFNRSLLDETEKVFQNEENKEEIIPKKLIVVVTPTSVSDELRVVNLRRLGNTLRLVPSPLLWVVVEKESDSSVSETLRKTGVMYRHLVFKENFTDFETEMDFQRNFALNHIEHHRLNGIVHFSKLSNVYDLNFFDEIRAIEVFGTWPTAYVSANRKRVRIEGPVCESSQVVGWNLQTTDAISSSSSLHSSSFAFNSSILWDPERWGRSSSVQETSQNTIKFIKKEILEEETKLVGIPADGCSKIMTWNWNFHILPSLSSIYR